MIAIAMYVSLGVIVTLLMTMLIMPLIWRRAVRLTEKRIKAEMPISYSELKAEKDMQRAEQAIELRRLEVTTDASLEEVANQTLKINRLHKTIVDRDDEIAQHKASIAALENDLTDQTDKTTDTEGSLSSTQDELAAAMSVIAGLEDNKKSLETQNLHLETGLSEHRIETVAQMAQIENHKNEISDLTGKLKETTSSLGETKAQLSQKSADYDRTKERFDSQQSKIDELQSQLADKDTEIDTLSRRLERATAQNATPNNDSSERFAAAEAARVQAEAKIASMALQLDHASEGDVTDLIAKLQSENADLDTKLAETREKLDEVSALLEQEQQAAPDDIDEFTLSPQELLLRDEIKNIAARVTGVAAEMDGPDSQIHTLLADQQPETDADQVIPNGNGNGNGHHEETKPEETADQMAGDEDVPNRQDSAWDQVFSLADRIKDLNAPSKEKSANQ